MSLYSDIIKQDLILIRLIIHMILYFVCKEIRWFFKTFSLLCNTQVTRPITLVRAPMFLVLFVISSIKYYLHYSYSIVHCGAVNISDSNKHLHTVIVVIRADRKVHRVGGDTAIYHQAFLWVVLERSLNKNNSFTFIVLYNHQFYFCSFPSR